MKSEDNPHPHELISAFFDHVATPDETARLQDHLRGCAECRQRLQDFNAITTAVGEESVPPVPPHLAARIGRRIEAGNSSRLLPAGTSFWRSPFPLAAAATLLMATTIWMVWRREISAPNSSGTQALEAPARKSNEEAGPLPGPPTAPLTEAQRIVAQSDLEKTKTDARERPATGNTSPAEEGSAAAGLAGEVTSNGSAPRAAPPASPTAQAAPVPRGEPRSQAPAPQGESKRGDYLDLITSSGLTGEDYKKAKGRSAPPEVAREKDSNPSPMGYASEPPDQVLKESAQVDSPGEMRSLAYEGPEFSATFSEEGLVTLIARGYACSVTVAIPSSAAGAGSTRAIEDLSSLFKVASSREFLALGSSQDGSRKTMASPGSAGASSLALRNAEGDPIHSVPFTEPLPQEAPQVLRTLRQGIQVLIQQRYRKDLEARCGPLPPTLLPTP